MPVLVCDHAEDGKRDSAEGDPGPSLPEIGVYGNAYHFANVGWPEDDVKQAHGDRGAPRDSIDADGFNQDDAEGQI